MNRMLLTLSALFCLILGFQNCAKPNAVDSSAEGLATMPAAEAADHDPLLSVKDDGATEDVLPGETRVGRLYVLESVDGENGEVRPAKRITLQFSSLTEAPAATANTVRTTVLKRISFTATSECGASMNGIGDISRFRGQPLRSGSLLLRVTERTKEDGCGFASNAHKAFLEKVSTYVIVGQRLFLVTEDGHTAVFTTAARETSPTN